MLDQTMSQSTLPQPTRHIIMVDDDPEDVLLVEIALKRSKLPVSFLALPNAEALLSFIDEQKNGGRFEQDSLVLLDLNMPKMDGRKCLSILRNDLHLKNLPVVVYSTSDSYEDITKSYDQGASAYVCKPDDIDALEKLIIMLYQFWLLPSPYRDSIR